MIKITDNKVNSASSKFFESNKKFYILGNEYDKNNFEYTPLKIFNDGLDTDSLVLNQTLHPYALKRYFQNIKNNNILVDSNDENIIYISPFGYNNNNNINKDNYNLYINKIETNNSINNYNCLLGLPGYNYFNNNIVNFLGQSSEYIYCSNISSQYYSGNSFKYPNESYWNNNYSSAYGGQIVTNIISIPKKDLNSYKIIHTIEKCYGNVKIIKDTNNEIYFVYGYYGYNDNQFQIVKLNKNNNICEIIHQDKKDKDNDRIFDVVTPSDVTKIDDNNYKFYINLMERSNIDKMNDTMNVKHYNYIYECIFNTNDYTLKKTKLITENLDDLPEFGTYAGTYYNEIYHLENNGIDYLVTSKNGFVMNNDNVDPFRNDRIISYYKINNEIIEENNGIDYSENVEINLTKKNNGIYESNLIKKNKNSYIDIIKFPSFKKQVSPTMTNYDKPDGYQVTESKRYSTYYGYYVFDGKHNTYWSLRSPIPNSWIELSFPKEVRVKKVQIRNYSTSYGVEIADINGEIINNIILDNNIYEYTLQNEIKSDKIKFTIKRSKSNSEFYMSEIRYFDDRNLKFLIKSNNTIYTINSSNELIEVNENINLDKINELGVPFEEINFNAIPDDFILLTNDEWIEPLIISYVKKKEMTLLKNIYKSDINGDYYGMLFNKKNNSFLAISSNSSYIFDVNSENFNIIDLQVKAQEIGIDLEGCNYVANQDTEIYIYGNNKSNKIIVTQPEPPNVDEIVYPYTTNIKVSSYNYKGERIKSTLKHTIMGTKNVKFKENNGRILIKDTSVNDDVEIEIIVTEDSLFEIYSELEL